MVGQVVTAQLRITVDNNVKIIVVVMDNAMLVTVTVMKDGPVMIAHKKINVSKFSVIMESVNKMQQVIQNVFVMKDTLEQGAYIKTHVMEKNAIMESVL
mmetsp:Transcript_43193/g.66381  ORF Transcript_43193/g.66381 Transcript_43193/m.66381 type:complete len:99 (+) Transcript_43193:197-493(+)